MGCGSSSAAGGASVAPAEGKAVVGEGNEQRLAALEALIKQQAGQIADLERVAPKQLLTMHYNVLADQYGSNLQPWFLYGAEPPVTPDERKALITQFYEKDDRGSYKNAGWPKWAPDGLLAPGRRAQIERCDREVFRWEKRSARLWERVEREDPDVLTLVECDHYDDFWLPRLRAAGYDCRWRKRPRESSRDGCCVAWRRSLLELAAQGGADFGDSLESQLSGKLDRTCMLALLRYRRDPSCAVLLATTHLARNPENPRQIWSRGYQYGLLFRELLGFAEAHAALDAPVILSGDLNAQDVDELAGIERALVILAAAPAHPLLWSVTDAPTPPTTRTDCRCMRIDYVLYQAAKLKLLHVKEMPRLAEDSHAPIPDGVDHPSDHLPVLVRFEMLPRTSQQESAARQWLRAVQAHATQRPLSGAELRMAFDFFDKDGTGVVRQVELDAGMHLLSVPDVSGHVVHALADLTARVDGGGPPASGTTTIAGPEPAAGPAPSSFSMAFSQFALLYVSRMMTADASHVARQLEMAFQFFDVNDDGTLTHAELTNALDRIAPAPIRPERIKALVEELDANGDGQISLGEFIQWCTARYAKVAHDPTLQVCKSSGSITNAPPWTGCGGLAEGMLPGPV